MKFIQIFFQIAALYGFFITGKWIQISFELRIPGSIIGMVLFLCVLLTGIFPPKWFESGTEFLLKHMTFMFLPVTVGIVNYFSFFQGKGILLILVVLTSTIIVMASSAYIGQAMVKEKERHECTK